MRIVESDQQITVYDLSSFDLEKTIECGQCFRWKKLGNKHYLLIAHNQLVELLQSEECFVLKHSSLNQFNQIWRNYFDLDRDYALINHTLEKDEKFIEIINYSKGIRLLKQDPFEILISFILSSNRSIPIIQCNIEALCEQYGHKIGEFMEQTYFAFPDLASLNNLSPSDLRACKVGYRDAYIQSAIQFIDRYPQILSDIERMTYEQAYSTLQKIKGVGPKVAHCVLLFGYHKMESFPVDVWIERGMKHLYPQLKTIQEIQDFARENFGHHSGIVQQYLFYYAINHKIGK